MCRACSSYSSSVERVVAVGVVVRVVGEVALVALVVVRALV